MPSEAAKDPIAAVANTADASLSGLLALLLALARKGVIDAADLKDVGDAITSKVHADNHAGAHKFFELALPGYQPPTPND